MLTEHAIEWESRAATVILAPVTSDCMECSNPEMFLQYINRIIIMFNQYLKTEVRAREKG